MGVSEGNMYHSRHKEVCWRGRGKEKEETSAMDVVTLFLGRQKKEYTNENKIKGEKRIGNDGCSKKFERSLNVMRFHVLVREGKGNMNERL